MKKVNVEYGIDGRILKLSDNAVHYEQENLALHIGATIPTDKNVRGYIKAPNGNSDVTGPLEKKDDVYTLVVEDDFMAKGTLYVGFEAYDDTGCVERFEPLKVYVDGFVTIDGGNSDNVYVVTVEIAEVETLEPGGVAYVENIGTQKDVKLKFGIPRGQKGDDGYTPQKGTDYYTSEESEAFALEVEQKYEESLNNKVDKVAGKGLSTNDFTDDYKIMLDNPQIITAVPGSSNLITSGAVYDALQYYVRKEEGKGLSTNDFNDTFRNMLNGTLLKGKRIEPDIYNLVTSNAVYEFVDEQTKENIANILMQKIFETTVTEQDTVPITISEDMDGNPFKLDEAFICIKLPEPLTKSADWSGYINDGSSKPSTKCWFYFTANTTGKNFIAKAERMCEGVWFTQKFSNLTATATNNAYSSGYLMADVNYIDILTLHCEGIPVGSTVVVCGRKVLE